MERARCGCPVEDGIVMHGFDGPCPIEPRVALHPTTEDYCAAGGHAYAGDDGGRGRCYCGQREFSADTIEDGDDG